MNNPYTEPKHRVEKEAYEALLWQDGENFIRRLFGKPILKTGEEAHDEVLQSFLKPSDDRLAKAA